MPFIFIDSETKFKCITLSVILRVCWKEMNFRKSMLFFISDFFKKEDTFGIKSIHISRIIF